MLLLTSDTAGNRTHLLVEAKTSSNNAWYAVIESLRQLKLFQSSRAAQEIFAHRGSHDGTRIPVEAVILAPEAFYTSPGAKANATKGARKLLAASEALPGVVVRSATWDQTQRAIEALRPD